MNVPYRFSDGSGSILIPADQVHEVRLRLAGQGLPKGNLSGFEILENQKFGASQFLEQVNYQRALEGELARSINLCQQYRGTRAPGYCQTQRICPRTSAIQCFRAAESASRPGTEY